MGNEKVNFVSHAEVAFTFVCHHQAFLMAAIFLAFVDDENETARVVQLLPGSFFFEGS